MLRPFELSYTNVNLLVFLFIIPIIQAFVLDRKPQTRWMFKIIFFVGILVLASLRFFNVVDLFQAGVAFCEKMMHVHKCTYAESCVVRCTLFPLVVTIVLISLLVRGKEVKFQR